MPPSADLAAVQNLAVASLSGLAVGVEREWSGHASGPSGRFAGVRTFLLLGLLGGVAGVLSATLPGAAAVLLGGGAALSVAAYAMAVRRHGATLDGTTEGAALVVLALGTLAGRGHLALASGATAVIVLALGEKARVRQLVRHIGEPEMRAALQFAVLALVVLPLLPDRSYGPLGGFNPRSLWTVVLLFSALNFAGYVARSAAGPARGYGVTGLLGGLISSTAVTLTFARHSRREEQLSAPLALGVLAACTMLLPRVVVVSAILNPAVALALAPYLVAPLLVGIGFVVVAVLRDAPTGPYEAAIETRSPLRLRSAVLMAVAFQAALMGLDLVRRTWGAPGVLASAAALGLTDVDALTLSMSRMGDAPAAVPLAAQAIMVGIIANTVLKLALSATMGSAAFRARAAAGLAGLALATGIGLWLPHAVV